MTQTIRNIFKSQACTTKLQDSNFAALTAALQEVTRFSMTKVQESTFALPTAARQGAAQGGAA